VPKSKQHNEEVIRHSRAARIASQEHLRSGDVKAALLEARKAYDLARSNRGHQLTSEAWLALVEALAAVEGTRDEYREHAEGLFYWTETMADEIQLWLYPALDHHLEVLGLENLVARARTGRERAEKWLKAGNLNASTRIHAFHLEDVAAGRPVSAKALAIERQAAFYVDEMFDDNGIGLEQASKAWEESGRPDRAAFLRSLVADLKGGSHSGQPMDN
jgi:hypothetical protein